MKLITCRTSYILAPPSWKHEPMDVETALGETVSTKCSANGFPKPKITWIKNGISYLLYCIFFYVFKYHGM